jgi:hypothetical protein
MMVLTLTDLTQHHPRGSAISSVLVTAVAEDPAVLSIYPYAVTDGDPVVAVSTPQRSTTQVFFDRLPFPAGFTVVADENVLAYVVEYADL